MLSQQEIHRLLSYDPDTGIFQWRERGSFSRAREEAGYGPTAKTKGHIIITIHGRSYKAGQLAWIYMTGSSPKKGVAHKNGRTADNRWHNLIEIV